MKARRLSLTYSILFTAAVVVSLPRSAFADGGVPGQAVGLLPDSDPEISLALPVTLGQWNDATEEVDFDMASQISLGQFPQGRLATQPPFIDWHHWEFGGKAGLTEYSSAFKAKVDYILGLTTRVPAPGIPLGDWGLWAEAFVSHISRDLPFYYSKPAGGWYGGAVGADYTFVKTDLLVLRGQAGGMYAYWNHIHALQNGAGVIIGADLGFYWIKHYTRATLDINPQLNFDSKHWIGIYTLGFSYDF